MDTRIKTDLIGTTRQSSLPIGRAGEISLDLQNAIFEHRLTPGLKLSEDEVGELYGASRTIVRSALQSLAYSQLVTIEKNRGAFVAKPSVSEAEEVFQARALIEPCVAGMAADCITKKQVTKLNQHIEAEHDAMARGDMGKALALSGSFHVLIAEIAEHAVYANMVRQLISRSSLIIALYWKRQDTTCESHSHHALLDAFKNNDNKSAEDVMKSHIIDLHSGLDLRQKRQKQHSLATALSR